MSAHVPDPETGKFITPVTRSLFNFKVLRILKDGTAIVSAKVTELESGMSEKELAALPLDPPDKPAQLLLMTQDGRIYGPYGEKTDMKDLETVTDLSAWFELQRQPKPWVWHKVPLSPVGVGASVRRKMGEEIWIITHLKDEIVGGILCDVFKARLQRSDITVNETTWYYQADGYVVKREIQEKRAKEVSANLIQRRVL